jgi:predicted ABC-type ATPase
MKTLPESDQPYLIIVRGLPGSGKSYLAAALARTIGNERVVMLDPDAIDYDSTEYLQHVQAQLAEAVDPKLHAYRFLRAKAYQAIADRQVIIWNQPFTHLEIFHKMIGRLRDCAAEQGTELPILILEVEVDPALAERRVMTRKRAGGHGPTEATFSRFMRDYRSFAGQGYATVSVRGDAKVDESVATVLDAATARASQ